MDILAVGAGRDGTVSLTEMIGDIYRLNGLTGKVVHEYEARAFYNLYTSYKETKDESCLDKIAQLIDKAPEVVVGNGYHMVLDTFIAMHPRIKLISLRRANEEEHVRSLCKIAKMWPEFNGGYVDGPSKIKRLCAYHLGEMSKEEWDSLSLESRFRWYRNNVYSTVSKYRTRNDAYLELETNSLNDPHTQQKLADFVAFPGAIPPTVRHLNRRHFVSIDDFSDTGGKLALTWFREFSHSRFENEPSYAVCHALQMYHNIIGRRIIGKEPDFSFDLSIDEIASELQSLDDTLVTYRRWVAEMMEKVSRLSRVDS